MMVEKRAGSAREVVADGGYGDSHRLALSSTFGSMNPKAADQMINHILTPPILHRPSKPLTHNLLMRQRGREQSSPKADGHIVTLPI